VRGEVRDLLSRSPAYRELSDAAREQIATDMTKVAAVLADRDWLTDPPAADEPPGMTALRDLATEVDFPRFVASLIQGVFQAIIDTSIRQMEAYAELMASVGKQVDQFIADKGADSSARKLARSRQQMLATMVLMGINRIVVTNGRVSRS
jgi:hypothetical protein